MFGTQADLAAQLLVLLTLGWARELDGDTPGALTDYEQALAITESHGESVYRSHTLWATAIAVWRQGDRDRALRLLQQGLRLARCRKDPLMSATCLEALAWIVCREGSARRSVVLMGAAEALGRSAGSSTVVFSNLLVHHEECERSARRILGQHAFEEARRTGASLDLEAATDYALGEHPGEHPGEQPDEQPTAPPSAPGPSTELTNRERHQSGRR